MPPFTALTALETAHLTGWQAESRRAHWNELRAQRGLAEARLFERELDYLRSLPGFDDLYDAARAFYSAPFVHHQAAGLAQWQEHAALEVAARQAAAFHLEVLGL
jgi:hypothetical protein